MLSYAAPLEAVLPVTCATVAVSRETVPETNWRPPPLPMDQSLSAVLPCTLELRYCRCHTSRRHTRGH